MAKLMDSSIKLIDAKLETKVNRFLEYTNPNKGKTYKDSCVPDPVLIKTTTVKTDHKNVSYRTNNIIWRPGQTAFGCSTVKHGKVTMQKVHIIGQNSKHHLGTQFPTNPTLILKISGPGFTNISILPQNHWTKNEYHQSSNTHIQTT